MWGAAHPSHSSRSVVSDVSASATATVLSGPIMLSLPRSALYEAHNAKFGGAGRYPKSASHLPSWKATLGQATGCATISMQFRVGRRWQCQLYCHHFNRAPTAAAAAIH